MDIKLYILLKIVHFTENWLHIQPKIEYFTKIGALNQKLYIKPKIVHLTKNWTFYWKLCI